MARGYAQAMLSLISATLVVHLPDASDRRLIQQIVHANDLSV